jgi:hypothetical protein
VKTHLWMSGTIGIVTASVATLFGVIAAATPEARAQKPASLQYRWVYCADNLQVDENVPKLEQLMARAAAAGYNGILLADYKFNILDRVPDRYFTNAARVRQRAAELKLDIIPAVAPIGYSEGLLSHDPNLAEGLPVQNQLLVAQGATARLEPDPSVQLSGGDFERAESDKFAGWDFQDLAGKASTADSDVKHGGQSSMRIKDIASVDRESGNCRVAKKLAVSPFRQYHLSVWAKTDRFRSHASIRLFAIGADGTVLSHSNLGVAETQDWTQHHVLLNSLDNRQMTIYAGVWGGKAGTLWLDDLKLEETAFVNLLRRPGCPFTLSREDGTPLMEGRDFVAVADPKMGVTPWPGGFDVFHEPPILKFTDAAGVKDGDRFRASYYHAVTIYDAQVPCCLSEPKVFEIVADQVAGVDRLFQPRGYMLSHDEIRVAGWCDLCRNSSPRRTPGQLLADNARRCAEVVRKIHPNAELFVWSDMFDPAHNAVDKFYLVNGSLEGSWEGLPSNVTIVNWNSGAKAKSLPFFGRRGHRQILAGYYDGKPDSIVAWLRDAGGESNVAGVMYTTWRQNYEHLEAFARYAWGDAKK